MYNTTFDVRKAKYLVVLKESIYSENRDRKYGIYTYSFEDACVFLEKELIQYFSKNNLKEMHVLDRKEKLYWYYKQFRIFDLRKKVNIGEEYFNRKTYYDTFSDLKLHKLFYPHAYSEPTEYYLSKSFEIIERVAVWNNVPYNLKYSYPVFMINEEYPHWRTQYRPRFHNRDHCWNRDLRLHKSEMIAGTDPEYNCYLTARQRNRQKSQNWGKPWKKNRFQIPGDWKHYHKCRKQWAKSIENPSYEKLSKAVWRQELKGMEI